MRHAKAWLALGAAALLGLACGQSTDLGGSPSSTKGGGSTSGGGDVDAGAASDSTRSPTAAGTNQQGSPASNGVMLVHSASFPAFRLCFENLPDILPQPDATVMPEANVVGVETGSLVRINQLTHPGAVYVISERHLRNNAAAKSLTCGELIAHDGKQGALEPTNDYLVTKPIDRDIGVDHAEVLAITGCGTQGFLDVLDGAGKGNSKSCGDGWLGGTGNLAANIVTLDTSYDTPTDAEIPVQLYNLSAATSALSGTVSVMFGDRTKPSTPLVVGDLYGKGPLTKLAVDQSVPAAYGSNVFDVKVTIGTDTVEVSPSLADVQQLSSPTDEPTSYYKAASNYALLLLGDPSHKAELSPGVPNPAYNPRRALHLLAVPVLDPTKVDTDAGTDAATQP